MAAVIALIDVADLRVRQPNGKNNSIDNGKNQFSWSWKIPNLNTKSIGKKSERWRAKVMDGEGG